MTGVTIQDSEFESLRRLGQSFWSLYISSCLIDLGLCLYFFLFSLFLVEHNFSEQNIGLITAALTVGTIIGTLLVGFISRRLDLRTMMLIYVIAAPACLALRVFYLAVSAQIALALVAGAMMSIWSVCFSPTLARLTTPANRAFGFSLFVATGIASGALAGMLGGYLPSLLHRVDPQGDGLRTVLLVACLILLIAAGSITRLGPGRERREQRFGAIISTFLVRFLIAATVWNFALSFFTPFANVYLSRQLGLPLMRIGQIYTISQLITVATVLLVPLLYRKVGLVTGIALTQLAAAMMFLALSRVSAESAAVGVYLALTSVQWIGGPGLSSLLMNRTEGGRRGQASAMYNMLNLAAQAGAAALAGRLFALYGYSRPLAANAAVAALAAALLYGLLNKDAAQPDPVYTNQVTNL